MINRILMELYDDYSNNNIDSLIEFSKKTFPSDGTDNLFVGCTLIMFSNANGFKARYDCSREQLLDIVYALKEKIGNSNLLEFYVDRLNTHKGINKYFNDVFNDPNIEKHMNLIIEYLEQFKPKFIENIKKHDKKIKEYIKNNHMNYKLIKSSNNDIDKLIEYKKSTIYEYANNLQDDEIKKINNYVKNTVPELLDNYSSIIVDNKTVGCLLVTTEEDGVLLDEIFIEEEYRNKGIGTNVIKNVLKNNNVVYLWVYKENKRAISLYKRVGFEIINETDLRYYMKNNK